MLLGIIASAGTSLGTGVVDGISDGIGDATSASLDAEATSAEAEVARFNELQEAARQAYPGKAGTTQLHHITPKYLGGPKDGPLVELDAAYHQQITNEFRVQWPYGSPRPSPQELQRIMQAVYTKYPLSPGG